MDVAVWWRERRWLALLELVDQLPFASRLNEAVRNDPAQADLIASQPSPEDPWSPRVAEYDLHAVMLREVIHGLVGVQHALVWAHGGKPGQPPEFPAPVTEVDRALRRIERQWAVSVLSRYGFGEGDI